jgi:hypothetical protein
MHNFIGTSTTFFLFLQGTTCKANTRAGFEEADRATGSFP